VVGDDLRVFAGPIDQAPRLKQPGMRARAAEQAAAAAERRGSTRLTCSYRERRSRLSGSR
jgi:hypothetical protein